MSKSYARFSDVTDTPYGCFSVLSPHHIVVRHIEYPSVHHYFLCERFAGSELESKIREAASLWQVDRLVKEAESKGYQRDDWDQIKTDVMLLGTYYKFKQNLDAQIILLQTGTKTILNHNEDDAFWGDGGDGKSGKNLLGVVLMATRKRLQGEEKLRKKEGGRKKQ